MTILGAIFAGGASRRFGSDKAVALLEGRALLDHVADALRSQCDAMVVVGRDWPGLARIDDRPRPDLGPLGALAGALVHAAETGFDHVLTSGCDLPDLPPDLVARLAPAPAVVRGQPLLGLWPSKLATALLAYLDRTEDRSMRGWIAAAEAASRDVGVIANINRPADLDALSAVRRVDPRSPR